MPPPSFAWKNIVISGGICIIEIWSNNTSFYSKKKNKTNDKRKKTQGNAVHMLSPLLFDNKYSFACILKYFYLKICHLSIIRYVNTRRVSGLHAKDATGKSRSTSHIEVVGGGLMQASH